jgi:hypothetical protein
MYQSAMIYRETHQQRLPYSDNSATPRARIELIRPAAQFFLNFPEATTHEHQFRVMSGIGRAFSFAGVGLILQVTRSSRLVARPARNLRSVDQSDRTPTS